MSYDDAPEGYEEYQRRIMEAGAGLIEAFKEPDPDLSLAMFETIWASLDDDERKGVLGLYVATVSKFIGALPSVETLEFQFPTDEASPS